MTLCHAAFVSERMQPFAEETNGEAMMGRTKAWMLAGGAAVSALSTGAETLAQDAIDEIVVTARRVEENLQQIPVSVTAVTDEQLDVQQIETIGDLAASIPNLTATGGP